MVCCKVVMLFCFLAVLVHTHSSGPTRAMQPWRAELVDKEICRYHNITIPQVTMVRSRHNPIIRPHMLPGKDGDNINGPSIIEVPKWIKNPLGKYYMYFAMHHGNYIRFAFGDAIEGPWTIHKDVPVFKLQDAPLCIHNKNNVYVGGHIASPDVIIDHKLKRLRMYYHCHIKDRSLFERSPGNVPGAHVFDDNQYSFVAHSSTGLSFQHYGRMLGPPYMRVFQMQVGHIPPQYPVAKNVTFTTYYPPGHSPSTYARLTDPTGPWYALAKHGELLMSPNGVLKFITLADSLAPIPRDYGDHIRHLAVYVEPEAVRPDVSVNGHSRIWVYYSLIGAAPESIHRTLFLIDNQSVWTPCMHQEILRPDMPYEGSLVGIVTSKKGEVKAAQKMHEVRDPFVFVCPAIKGRAQKNYLVYSVAGELGLGVASIVETK